MVPPLPKDLQRLSVEGVVYSSAAEIRSDVDAEVIALPAKTPKDRSLFIKY